MREIGKFLLWCTLLAALALGAYFLTEMGVDRSTIAIIGGLMLISYTVNTLEERYQTIVMILQDIRDRLPDQDRDDNF